MILFQYLDNLPTVPADLVVAILETVNTTTVDYAVPVRAVTINNQPVDNVAYNRHQPIDKLTQWLHNNITADYVSFGVQVQTPNPHNHTHFPHTDSSPRHWALNYNIQPGGDRVITSWYQEEGHPTLRKGTTRPTDVTRLNLIESVQVEPFRWHLLNTQVLHGVENIMHPRIAITVGFKENPLDGTLS